VETRYLAVSWSESMTRSTSSKLRPVVIGYTRISLIFLSGPMTKTLRTVWLSAAVRSATSPPVSAGSIPYAFQTAKSAAARLGELGRSPWVSSMSFAQPSWSEAVSTEMPMIFTFLRSNSGLILAMYPSSVVQTGVKSFGCEKRIAQESPIQSWKLISPSVESAVKSGAMSLIVSPMPCLLRGSSPIVCRLVQDVRTSRDAPLFHANARPLRQSGAMSVVEASERLSGLPLREVAGGVTRQNRFQSRPCLLEIRDRCLRPECAESCNCVARNLVVVDERDESGKPALVGDRM